MQCHGSSPDGMLLGAMIRLPKGKWINLSCSDNYRVITLSSIFGMLLDFIILNKEEHQLNRSDLQFSFKKALLLVYVLAWCKEQYLIMYIMVLMSMVYCLMLVKHLIELIIVNIFHILIIRGFCPMYSRLLINMYTNQKLKFKRNSEFSELFSVTNGVKQEGVISQKKLCLHGRSLK